MTGKTKTLTLREANPAAADMWAYDETDETFIPEKIPVTMMKNGRFRCYPARHLFFRSIGSAAQAGPPYYCCDECAKKEMHADKDNIPKSLVPDRLPAEWSEDNRFPAELYNEKSGFTAKWICRKCGQEYEQVIEKVMSERADCPYCSGKKLLKGKNSIADVYPELVKHWSADNMYSPEEVLCTCDRELLWNCSVCGNEYWETVKNIISMECSCPYCDGRIFKKGVNSLFDKYPELKLAWSEKNTENPERIIYTAKASYIWKCNDCGGEYWASVPSITSGNSHCPYCADEKFLPGLNSLQDKYPEITNRWGSNNHLKPSSVFYKSHSTFFWYCETCGGQYLASVEEIVNGAGNCPYCTGKRLLPGYNSLDIKYPDLAKLWSEDNIKSPDNVLYTSRALYLWKCDTCGGTDSSTISDRLSENYTCPYCTGNKFLKGFNSVDRIYPELSEFWSKRNLKKSCEIIFKSEQRYFWKCKKCHGIISATIEQMKSDTYKCPYCENKKPLKGYNTVADKYPELLKFWAVENDLKPGEIPYMSPKPVLWKCIKCGGLSRASVQERNSESYRCQYCDNKKFLKGLNSLKEVNSCLLAEWDYKNNYLLGFPQDVFYKSGEEYWWICKDCKYHYKMSPKQRSYYLFRHQKACPHCKGYRRNKVYFF